MNGYKLIDLFAGTGAFSHTFSKKGVKCVFANDMTDGSEAIYNKNHKLDLTKGDINDVDVNDIPKHDILCGGFPCQPFSIAGKRKGFKDTRSNVFWKIIKILKKHKPKIIVLENVKNLQTHDKGKTFKTIIEALKKEKYHVKFKVLNTCKITKIPQNRERIYMVGFKNKKLYEKFDMNFEEVKNKKIKQLLEKKVDEKYYYTDRFKIYNEIKKNITKNISTGTVYQYRRYYVRENKNKVCPTLTANMGSGGHNVPLIKDDKGIRKFTPRECFNLQGFPKKYKLPKISDSKLYKLAGNAVSVPVVELLVEKLNELLRDDKKDKKEKKDKKNSEKKEKTDIKKPKKKKKLLKARKN